MNSVLAPHSTAFPRAESKSVADPADLGIPPLYVTPTEAGGQVKAYCAGCGATHLYGRPEPGSDMIRTRQSHCWDERSEHHGRNVLLVEVEPGDPRLAAKPRGRAKRQ